jgi:selT/selW/selH-like putative selenoprotein
MIDVSLRTGSKGRFEVTLDDRLLFSKARLKRFPEKGEIVKLAQPVLGPPIDWR